MTTHSETSKLVVALATYHELQHDGHRLNTRLQGAIELIRAEQPVQVILEEWKFGTEVSFAATLQNDALKWENVGTPDEPQFETSTACLNWHPPTYDATKPSPREYGPVWAQERREAYMVNRIIQCMRTYEAGLFIVGLAHLHSMLSKLQAVGFQVKGYSWMGE